MAEDGLGEPHVGTELAEHRPIEIEHRFPVLHRIALRPEQVAPVLVHLPGAGEEHRQVPVGQVLVVRELLRPLDVDLRQRLADVAAAGVQHHPHPVLGIEAELDEVVSPAERPELLARLAHQIFHRGRQQMELLPERLVLWAVDRIAVLVEPDGNGALQCASPCAQVVRQVLGGQAGLHRADTAAHVDPDGGRADRALHRDHAPDRRALAVVDVRHGSDVMEDPRQRGDVLQLLERDALDLVGVRPRQDVCLAATDPLHAFNLRPPRCGRRIRRVPHRTRTWSAARRSRASRRPSAGGPRARAGAARSGRSWCSRR